MKRRYFPLQKRRIRRLWHPSTIRGGVGASGSYDIHINHRDEVNARCVGAILGVEGAYSMIPVGVAATYLRDRLPAGSRVVTTSEMGGIYASLHVEIPPQPLRISAKIRKLYEP
jgi:hypothetical protein